MQQVIQYGHEHIVHPIATPDSKDKIKLYPNPTNGTVFINMPNPNKVYVYNTLGILTKELYLEKGEHEIDISNFPSGVYLFRIANESIKLIKE
jgi:hypothetical protein